MTRRWYQVVDVGEDAVFEDVKRKDSKFWNEGKWDTFVEPLLPKERQTFIEIGCNAGLFLRKATEAGFRDVIGIEGRSQIIEQAEIYKKSIGGNYKLIPRYVGNNLVLSELLLADVVLISNMHYYLPVGTFSQLVDELRNRALYCIVVSARAKRRRGNALWNLDSVRGYFRDWHEVDAVEDIETSDDPAPRIGMYGVLFRGNVRTIQVDKFYGAWFEASKNTSHKSHGLATAMESFFRLVLGRNPFEYKDTEFYHYWRKREPRRSEKWTEKWLAYKASLARDIQENGIKEPIYLDGDNKLLDGIHRLCIAKLLGYKHVIIRKIQ